MGTRQPPSLSQMNCKSVTDEIVNTRALIDELIGTLYVRTLRQKVDSRGAHSLLRDTRDVEICLGPPHADAEVLDIQTRSGLCCPVQHRRVCVAWPRLLGNHGLSPRPHRSRDLGGAGLSDP